MNDRFTPFLNAMKRRILVLDGATGTMIQRFKPTEADYRGTRFKDVEKPQKGNNDLLCLTRPDIIQSVHRAYFEAGADIIETDSFNANAVSQAEYAMTGVVAEINFEAARLAREIADEFTRKNPEKPRFVAGSVGPTSRSCAMSPDMNDPAARNIDFDTLCAAYTEQITALIRGGSDLILVETCFDPINVKAAIAALQDAMRITETRVPLIISGTISDASGRLLTGQTIEAFYYAVSHAETLVSIGLNCALGAHEMRPHIERLHRIADCHVHVYPNAGLPNALGQYDQDPAEMAAVIRTFAQDGIVNLIGGCCGTTPDHIRAMAEAVNDCPPRVLPPPIRRSLLSGLEPLCITPESFFINVGERTNVAGSRKFLRLIQEKKYDQAMDIAREQIENGAQIIDINMDDALLDAEKEMVHFLRMISSDPAVARVPIMIDSSRWNVIESALKNVQGRCVVNSLSLKEGEARFLEHARALKRYGASVLVMAFDEAGQADTLERRIAITERAFALLTEKAGFKPEEIIVDVNVFAIATGIDAHNGYARDFIEAVREVMTRCPGILTSGGISNVSFSFRGNERIRKAVHAVFLYHAIKAGLSMGIVNPAQVTLYDELPEADCEVLEAAILRPTPESAEALIAMADRYRAETDPAAGKSAEQELLWRKGTLEERIRHALIQGISTFIGEDIAEAVTIYPTPMAVIDGPLMQAMSIVGERFGAGKMFLPQVVKTARVMRQAVDALMPYIEASRQTGSRQTAGKVLMATVKGDVHDIGKNIVSVVLQCNNYEVIDLGVMVPCEKIIAEAVKHNVDVVGLSGLITPSLEEMESVAKALKDAPIKPILNVGGATTSAAHTALKLRTVYPKTFHSKDATDAVTLISRARGANAGPFLAENDAFYTRIRETFEAVHTEKVPLDAARKRRFTAEKPTPIPAPEDTSLHAETLSPDVLEARINWAPFFKAWELNPQSQDAAEQEEMARLKSDALKFLHNTLIHVRCVYGFFPCKRIGDDIELTTVNKTLFGLRQQIPDAPDAPLKCISDFIDETADFIGAFAVNAGAEIEALIAQSKAEGNEYQAILRRTVADRLAEAAAEYVDDKMRRMSRCDYPSIRPAPGYPMQSDHSEKFTLFEILRAQEAIGATLTEKGMMIPHSGICSLLILHPQAHYFSIRAIGPDQARDYAQRKYGNPDRTEWLSSLLNVR